MTKNKHGLFAFKVKLPDGIVMVERSPEDATKRLRSFDELDGMELEVLGVPFGGHIMGRDAYGEAFHPETDIWMNEGDTVPVTYYHGFGPDDPYDWQKYPAVIGTAKLVASLTGPSTTAEEAGFWFKVKLDESEELAQRVKLALEAGADVKASSGAVGHLVRYGEAGLIDVWPVGELAIFDTNEWRRPANELAVVVLSKNDAEIASHKTLPSSFVPLDRSLGTSAMTLSVGDDMVAVTVDEAGTEAALEGANPNDGLALKSAAVPGSEADTQTENQIASQSELAMTLMASNNGLEEEMNEEEMKRLIEGVVSALKTENAGVATQGVSVMRDEGDQPWGSVGEFFKAVKLAGMYPSREDARLRPLKATGMSEGIPADGGYLVPEETAAGIVERMLATGAILSRISNDPVEGNTMVYNGFDETTHVGSVYGGLVGYWLAEGGTITGSKPKFYQMELKLKKVGALCYATDEQLEDTAALESWLTRNVPNVLRWYVESAIVSGDGLGKPLGITQSPCLVSQIREDANEINPSDFAAMWSRRWVEANDYVWLINQTVSAWMNTFAVGNWPVFMPQGSMVGAPYATLYGAPVIESEHVAAAKSAGDVLLCSLSQYQAISKGGVKSASSIHVSFTTDETAFRFIYRIDGAPLWHSALTPENGSTISPFISLSAAST